MLSFSRHGHFAQPRQQANSTATPVVITIAAKLPLATIQ